MARLMEEKLMFGTKLKFCIYILLGQDPTEIQVQYNTSENNEGRGAVMHTYLGFTLLSRHAHTSICNCVMTFNIPLVRDHPN